MNQKEKICRSYQAEVRCFEKIPYRFEFNGNIDKKPCSVIFPPGYSIYFEEFILDDPGPDNFVLVDGNSIVYHSKLKWEKREQAMWKKLRKSNLLNMKSNRRENIPCINTLKVTKYLETS